MASRLKRSNCPKWIFYSKNNKIFMYLLAPFILQNLKRILRADPEFSGCAIFGHKMAHLSWTKFFDTNQYYYFHLLVGPFHCAKFTKTFYSRSKVVDPKWPICPKPFFWKIFNIIFIELLAPFTVQNFKKILPELCGCAIFGHKIAHLPKWEFFQKTC